MVAERVVSVVLLLAVGVRVSAVTVNVEHKEEDGREQHDGVVQGGHFCKIWITFGSKQIAADLEQI